MRQTIQFEPLAKALAPTVHLHPSDKYRPCAVDWYLPKVSLWLDNKTMVLPEGRVNSERLLEVQSANPRSKLSLRVEPNPPGSGRYDKINPKNPTYLGQGIDAPCYYMKRKTTSGHLALQYFFFYAYNGGMLPNILNKLGFEAHEGDWEYITVLLDWNEETGDATLYAVNYSGHGYTTCWEIFENPKPKPVSQLRPITVYSAWHSHASYATPGEHDLLKIPSGARGLIGGYDKTAAGGPTWVTANNLKEIRPNPGGGDFRYDPLWANYLGDWGADVTISPLLRKEGPSGPTTKSYNVDSMGTVDVFYEPQDGQTFRCSKNFPSWNVPPNGGYLNVQVDTKGRSGTPVFAFDHDQLGADTRWYSHKKGGDSFKPDSENGESGDHDIYLGTTSPLPPNTNGSDTYQVSVTWSSASKPLYQHKPSKVPPEARLMSSVEVHYKPQNGQSFRCSPNFEDWNPEGSEILYFQIELAEGHTVYPVFAVDHDKSGSDTRWYTDVTDGSCFSPYAQNGGPGRHELYVGTLSDLPAGVKGDDQYTVNVFVYSG